MKNRGSIALTALFIVFLIVSIPFQYSHGISMGKNFLSFTLSMLMILPGAFIIIGLFQVWISREKVEKHLGKGGPIAGYLWMILLAGTTVGGLYVAFPVAAALYEKGARTQIVLSYIGFAAVCRIPMAVFEASFLGVKFTVIRLLVSIPLVIISSALLSRYLSKTDWTMRSGNREDLHG